MNSLGEILEVERRYSSMGFHWAKVRVFSVGEPVT
jgi:hypothetical protein